jgi:MraZ protein
MLFAGEYAHQVDPKGRVAVPAEFRKGLPPGSVIARGADGRLVIRPPEEWQAIEGRYRLTAQTARDERTYIRQLYASAREVELDQQGRILLTGDQRAMAKIGEVAIFVGVGNVVEIVGEEVWNDEKRSFDADAFTELGDRINREP